ncbi:MAG: LexA family transcriptional regulator [Desulfohalobiaceae bacterium]|nr:LexA family transcriptional regulator [Desulfohalobiaceae bacterium]
MKGTDPDLRERQGGRTGFSSAGEDFRGRRLDLNDLLVRRPASTFFLRAEEETELGGGIWAGDILVTDRALDPDLVGGSLVVAVVQGEMLLRLVYRRRGRLWLVSGGAGSAVEVTEESDFQVWGVVIYVLHPVDTR